MYMQTAADSFDALYDAIAQEAGYSWRLRSATAKRQALRCVIDTWPIGWQQYNQEQLKNLLTAKAQAEYERRYGMGPLGLWLLQMLITLIVEAIINWLKKNPTPRGLIITNLHQSSVTARRFGCAESPRRLP